MISDDSPSRGPLGVEALACAETLRALRLCHPGWETVGPLTFSSERQDWEAWRTTMFEPVILPAFLAARSACAQGRRRDLAACDSGLDQTLAAPSASASRFAGSRLAREFTVPDAEKLWRWYRGEVEQGALPGHFTVMCALRSAAFHLAPAAALGALLFLEARGGRPDDTEAGWLRLAASALPAETGFRLRAA